MVYKKEKKTSKHVEIIKINYLYRKVYCLVLLSKVFDMPTKRHIDCLTVFLFVENVS